MKRPRNSKVDQVHADNRARIEAERTRMAGKFPAATTTRAPAAEADLLLETLKEGKR